MMLPGILGGLLRNRRTSVTSVSRSTFEYLIIGLVKKIICIICFVCDLFNRQMYFKHALSSRIFATNFWIRSMVHHRMDKSTTTRFLNKILHRGEFFFLLNLVGFHSLMPSYKKKRFRSLFYSDPYSVCCHFKIFALPPISMRCHWHTVGYPFVNTWKDQGGVGVK